MRVRVVAALGEAAGERLAGRTAGEQPAGGGEPLARRGVLHEGLKLLRRRRRARRIQKRPAIGGLVIHVARRQTELVQPLRDPRLEPVFGSLFDRFDGVSFRAKVASPLGPKANFQFFVLPLDGVGGEGEAIEPACIPRRGDRQPEFQPRRG